MPTSDKQGGKPAADAGLRDAPEASGAGADHLLSRMHLDVHVAHVSMGLCTDLGPQADAASVELRGLQVNTLDLGVMRHNEVVAHVT